MTILNRIYPFLKINIGTATLKTRDSKGNNIEPEARIDKIYCNKCHIKFIGTSRNLNKRLYGHKRNLQENNIFSALFVRCTHI